MLRIIFLIHFFILLLSAKVILNVPPSFVEGENIIFTFKVSGSDVKFPKIKSIAGFMVQEAGTSKSISNINGQITQSIQKRYVFKPTKTVTIPSFKFLIDNKDIYSKEQIIEKKLIKKTQSKLFDFSMNIEQDKLYVGESTQLKLIFKYKKELQLTQLELQQINFDNIWEKKLSNSKNYEKDGYVFQELSFLIFPQKSGLIRLKPLRIIASVIDVNANSFSFFSNPTKQFDIYSNELQLNVKPLPKDVNLFGDFSMQTFVDKKKIDEGEALSFKVKITGVGNIDDVNDITLKIKGATVYANEPIIKASLENNEYKGSFEKTFSVISDNDFLIPSISIAYFDKVSHTIKYLKSKPYKIYVNKLKTIKKQVLQKNINQENINFTASKEISTTDKIFFFFLGVMTCVLVFLVIYLNKKRKNNQNNEESPLIKKVRKTKNNQELLNLLVPYVTLDKTLDKQIYRIEKNEKESFKEVKSTLLKLLKNSQFKGL